MTATAVLTAAGVLGLTACSGGGESAAGDSGAAETSDSVALSQPESAADGGRGVDGLAGDESSAGAAGSSGTASRAAAQQQLVIRTASMSVVSADLAAAREDVARLVQRFGGLVAQERSENDAAGRSVTTTLTLRVPSARFADTLSGLEDLGEVRSLTTDAEDVTTEVIDVASRIRTQEVSLGRLRGFLDEARSVSTIIRLESEIARREADLASLRAQQAYLDDQTSLSTIDLRLRQAEEEDEVAPVEDDAGFVAGLRGGWDALTDVLLVGATALGALLPFAVVLAVLGVPVALWLRSTRRRRAPAAG